MTDVTWEVVDGRIRYNGRTLKEWVPEVVADIVAAANPRQILLFGSVARGDEGPDSDIDVLVVLPEVDPARRHELMSDLRVAIKAPIPVDVFVTDPAEISFLYWPMREGQVVYELRS